MQHIFKNDIIAISISQCTNTSNIHACVFDTKTKTLANIIAMCLSNDVYDIRFVKFNIFT